MNGFYKKSLEEIFDRFATNPEKGLSGKQVTEYQKKYGPNLIAQALPESLFILFLRQFQSPLIYILLIAALLIFLVGQSFDAFVISGVLFFNAIVGAIQEGRAKKILERLRTYLVSNVVVLRDGDRIIVPAGELVPGDIIIVQEGEKIPADARLLEAHNILVDEAMLTGESKSIEKQPGVLTNNVLISDQTNMLFKGTYVFSGFAKAVVVATGQDTEIGRIGRVLQTLESEMPLKKEIDTLSQYILYFIIGMCFFLLLVGLWQERTFADMLVMLTALFICVIPEGLPVIMTITLVAGAYRMAQSNVLVKRLQAAEGLGRVDIILVDKTGTLTRNEMVVSKIFCQDALFTVTGKGYSPHGTLEYNGKPVEKVPEAARLMALGAALLNESEVEYKSHLSQFVIKGDPTQAALSIFAQKLGFNSLALHKEYRVLYELPFQSKERYQAGIFEKNGEILVYIAGAPEVIMQKTINNTPQASEALFAMLKEGFRVVAFAYKKYMSNELPEDWRKNPAKLFNDNLLLGGFFAIQDAIRDQVKESVINAQKAGIKVVMVTGDHKQTALFVARTVGIFKEGDAVLEGKELENMTDEELLALLPKVTVFARVIPEQKLRIVQLLHKKGYLVAMTGDGVNDAPSLVAADLGIGMGLIGTEVAKEASDIILLDDSFASIVLAIKQGRHIFATLRRVVSYFFTTNMAEILIVFFALIFNLPLPLLAVQILWLNLITDGFFDVALALEPEHEQSSMMSETPAKLEYLVDWKVFFKMLYLSIPMALGSLTIFYYYQDNLALARTMTLVAMALYQWFNAWNSRSEKYSVITLGFFSNKWLILATFFVFALQCILLYEPHARMLFKTVPLSFEQWLLLFACSAPLFILEELRKMVANLIFEKK
ncbi:MAG: cation-translocating P-type ATPase [Candidatus Babeliales bacterium]